MKRTELAAHLIPSLTNAQLVDMYTRAVRETAREKFGTQARGEAQAVEQALKEALTARLSG